jgi:serine/threonine protein kinase
MRIPGQQPPKPGFLDAQLKLGTGLFIRPLPCLVHFVESPELWKWEKSSLVHREMFIKLLQYAKLYPKYIKEINEVRFCCSKEFLIGMGRDGIRVYVGLRKDGHEMAVKRLPKDVCTDLAQQEKKVSEELTEARSNYVVNSLSLDSDSDKEFLFLIMDLCEETLENFVHRSSLDELVTTAPDIIRHILKGLADLHHGSMPILHRDVQPSNILRNVHGNWLLADFGISRILTADSNTHQSNQGGMEGCNWRAVESSYASSEDTGVRYKKESDIQVGFLKS